MDFQFDLYEPKRPRAIKNMEAVVEVTPSGRLFFNKKATDLLAGKTACKLGFDAGNVAIGVLPVEEGDSNSFPVRYTAKGAYIGAKRFFKHVGVLPLQLINALPVKAGNFIGLKL